MNCLATGIDDSGKFKRRRSVMVQKPVGWLTLTYRRLEFVIQPSCASNRPSFNVFMRLT